MSTSNLYTLFAVQAGSTFIDQVERYSYSAGIDELILRANGSLNPQFAAIGHQAPAITLTTTNLVAALASGAGGWSASGANPAKFWFRKFTNLGTLDSGATAIKLNMAQGLILPQRLTADQRGSRLDLMAVPVYDGTNLPFVVSVNQSLAGSPAIANVHVAGKISIGGTVIQGVQSINIDFGVRPILASSDGDPFNTFGAVEMIAPSITVNTTDMSVINTLTTQASGGAVILYLRNVLANSTRASDATASHIKFTATAGFSRCDVLEASMGSAGGATIRINPIWDGTNNIFAINTASAIS